MKIENLVTVNCAAGKMEFLSSGSDCAVFRVNGKALLHVRRTAADTFPEAQGLPEKLRKHIADNAISAEINSSNVIPFGCEYKIDRHWKIAGNICELTGDISALHGGRIKELFLEELFFPGGKDMEIEFLVFGENSFRKADGKAGVIYDDSEMIQMLRVISPEGKVEFYAGDDLWRHRCSNQISGAESRHVLEMNENGMTYSRMIFRLPEDIEPEKRPWRFKSLFAFTSAENIGTAAKDQMEKLALTDCFAKPSSHRELRAFVRKQDPGSKVLLQGDFPQICSDGSHLSRFGRECIHGDLGEVFNEWLWANGVMQKKGGFFAAESRNKLFESSVILNVLQNQAILLSFPEEL